MYQAIIFSLLLLTHLAFAKTNPLTDEEPLYTGTGSTASTTSTSSSLGATSSTKTASQTTAASSSTSGCKLDESVLLCLCDTQFAGQKELCYAAAEKPGPMNAFLAAYQAKQAVRGATSNSSFGAAAQTASTGQMDPILSSLYKEVQQTGGMDSQTMMMLLSVLLGDSGQLGASMGQPQPMQADPNGMPPTNELAFSGSGQ